MLYGKTPLYTFQNAGSFEVILNVTDARGNWALDFLSVSVIDITDPTPKAGDDLEADIGSNVAFDGAGSSDNVGIVNHTWSFMYNDSLHSLYGEKVFFRFLTAGHYSVRLDVADDAGNKAFDYFQVNITDPFPPIVNAGEDLIIFDGTIHRFEANFVQDHSPIKSLYWSFNYNSTVQVLTGSDLIFSFNIPGIYLILLTVEDIWNNTATDEMKIEVRDITPPWVDAGADVELNAGERVNLAGKVWDNSDIAENRWGFFYNGSVVLLKGINVSFVFQIPGNYIILFTAEDIAGNSATDILWVNVSVSDAKDNRSGDKGADDPKNGGINNTDNGGNNGNGSTERSNLSDYFMIIIIASILLFACIIVIFLRTRPHKGNIGAKKVGELDNEGDKRPVKENLPLTEVEEDKDRMDGECTDEREEDAITDC